jgi:putative ABC transport system permease protein
MLPAELRFAARRLLRSPLHLAAGLLAFALGIGMNTAMYSIGEALVYRPVDLPHLDRLVLIENSKRDGELGLYQNSPADFLELRSRLQSFERLAMAEDWDATITRDTEPEQVFGALVSQDWFATTGAHFELGQGFQPGNHTDGQNRVAVITHGLWTRRFGQTPDIIGKPIVLNLREHRIVGVLKETSRFPAATQVFAPMVLTPEFSQRRGEFAYLVAGRLKPNVNASQAQAELNTVFQSIAARYPDTHAGRSAALAPLAYRVTGDNSTAVQFASMLSIAAGFVLLIACANVANLQLARVSGRAREFAILNALGSGSWRAARTVLIESVLLALAGVVPGVLMAVWSLEGIKRLLPSEIWQYAPMWPFVKVNAEALMVALAAAIAAGIISAVWPAWNSTRGDAQDALREGGRAMSSGAGRQWFRGAMVAAQMMLALILLIGSGLMVRSANSSLNIFTSKQPENVATLQFVLPASKYADAPRRQDFIRKLEANLQRVPGAASTSLVNHIPLADGRSAMNVVVEGRPEPKPADYTTTLNLTVSPGYFQLLRVPLLQGRTFTAADAESTDPVCIIDEILAKNLFPRENPLGRRLAPANGVAPANRADRKYCRIVGVVAKERSSAWDNQYLNTLYRPILQVPGRAISVMVRSDAAAEPLLPMLKQAVFAVDPDQPVRDVRTYQNLISTLVSPLWLVTTMMTALGVVALLLASIGLYSVMSYTVTERTSEIGMRVAMGATPRSILGLLAKQSVAMCGIGIGLGLALGYVLAQVMSGLVFGVDTRDFWRLSSVSLILIAVAAVALYLPARRAMRMDPSEALRHD